MASKDNHSKPVVLIAEDEPLLRLHAADLLEERGYEVVEAEDAAAALRVLEDRPDVRLLFTDIQCQAGSTGWTWPGKSMHAGLTFCW
jgi:two-component system, response regulator PdtaR